MISRENMLWLLCGARTLCRVAAHRVEQKIAFVMSAALKAYSVRTSLRSRARRQKAAILMKNRCRQALSIGIAHP
jgi:hypothetical protein